MLAKSFQPVQVGPRQILFSKKIEVENDVFFLYIYCKHLTLTKEDNFIFTANVFYRNFEFQQNVFSLLQRISVNIFYLLFDSGANLIQLCIDSCKTWIKTIILRDHFYHLKNVFKKFLKIAILHSCSRTPNLGLNVAKDNFFRL